jgi:hypothetical protein
MAKDINHVDMSKAPMGPRGLSHAPDDAEVVRALDSTYPRAEHTDMDGESYVTTSNPQRANAGEDCRIMPLYVDEAEPEGEW